MRKHTGFLIGSILLGVCSAGAVSAQEQLRSAQAGPAANYQRERAPGVPMAPSPGIVEQREGAQAGLNAKPQSIRQAHNAVQSDRDLPMPRGVPSIIAP